MTCCLRLLYALMSHKLFETSIFQAPGQLLLFLVQFPSFQYSKSLSIISPYSLLLYHDCHIKLHLFCLSFFKQRNSTMRLYFRLKYTQQFSFHSIFRLINYVLIIIALQIQFFITEIADLTSLNSLTQCIIFWNLI